MGDKLLSKCQYNNHHRSFVEHGVCNKRDQLQREKPAYPMRCKNQNCPSDKPLRQNAFRKHMENFKIYGKCYAPKIRRKPIIKEFPKLCKNPDCPMQKPLSKKTWYKHHASFTARGFCPRSKKSRLSINEFAKDLAISNMVQNVG